MNASTLPISVYLITRNEAGNLQRLLPTLAQFAEVVIVDCGSTDTTLEVTRQFANVRTAYRSWTGFSDQKNHALALCTQPWVLNLDADEALTNEYIAAMQQFILADNADALRGPRVLLRWGKRSRSFARDDMLVRCFRRGAGYYPPARVHERLVLPLSVLGCYLGKGYFRDGAAGILTSMNHAYYNFMKYAKLWELQQSTTKVARPNAVTAVASTVPVPAAV